MWRPRVAAKAFGIPKSVIETTELLSGGHCVPDDLSRRDANRLAPRGKAVELGRTEPVEMVQPVRYRYAGDEAVSPTRADGSAVANLPRAPDEKPMEVKGPLGQVFHR